MKISKARLFQVVISAVALLTVWFLIYDICRLQKLYELANVLTHSHSVLWPTPEPSEIQAMIAARQITIALTIIVSIIMVATITFVSRKNRHKVLAATSVFPVLVLICILICAMIYVSLGVVNGTINPLLGLFTVLFLWGSWRIFRSHGWTNRFQCVAFLLCFLLCIATIIWGIAFYYTRQEYHKYVEWIESDECPIREKLMYMWDGIGVYEERFGGRYIYGTAPFLFIAWLFFIGYLLSERKKPTLNVLEACHRLALIEGQKENKRKGENKE